MQIDWVVVLLLVIFWGALGLIAAIVGREVWWQVRAAVAGIREWRAERSPVTPADVPPPAYEDWSAGHASQGEPSLDDAWAEELHRINGLGKMGDLTRPIAHQTHYEVEAVIRQLGHADWLPAAA